MYYRGNLGCLWLLLLFAFLLANPTVLVWLGRFFFVFILGLLAVGWIGSWWLRRQAVRYYTSNQSERHNRFVELLVDLLVRMAEVDGELSRAEVTTIRLFFQQDLGYRDEQLAWIRDLIKESRRSQMSVQDICERLASGYNLQERFIVLQVLGRVAGADGRISPEEQRLIEQVADLLGLAPFVRMAYGRAGGGFGGGFGGDFGGGAAQSSTARVDAALAELGLERGASPEAIKSAWRSLSKEHHPDRVTHLGEEFRKIAEERMRKINAAYDTLKEAGLAG
jgi:DnaJ like chaperone protein